MAQDRSDYYFNLHSNVKSRYEEKVIAIDLSIDPFSIQENEFELRKDLGQIFHMLTFLRT